MSSGDKRAARTEMAKALRDIFKKYTRGARASAWRSISSESGKEEVEKVLNNPGRSLAKFRTLNFKEWLNTD